MRKLIINGKEITAVNVTFGGTAAEKYAASEMRKYLSRAAAVKTTNGDYPITLSIDPSIGRDGFVIKPCGEAGLHITGGNGRGVIYGVYEFFEHFAGCRFFMPGLETLGEGDIVVDEEIDYEWMRIPHFYTSFYVYQYATGYSTAIAFSKKILEEGKPAVENYKKFLSGGCSADPVSLLKIAGVDITKKESIQAALDVFGSLLDEMEKLVEE